MTLNLEPKVKAGAAGGAGSGAAGILIVWLLVTYVPGFRTAPPEILALIPVALGWAGHVIAAYAAPHDASRDPAAIPSPASGLRGNVQLVPPQVIGPGVTGEPSAGTGGFPPSAFPGVQP